jgi:hypothetical protein
MLVVWVIGLFVLLAFHFGFVARQAKAVNALRGQVIAKADRFTFLKAAKSPREQEHLAEAQKELERQYSDFVFTSEQLNELDFELRALADKNNLSEFSARHVGTTTKIIATPLKQIAQRDLVLSFGCTFPDFLRFVNEMERHQPILIADQYTLRPGGQKEMGLTCTLECSLLYQAAGTASQ